MTGAARCVVSEEVRDTEGKVASRDRGVIGLAKRRAVVRASSLLPPWIGCDNRAQPLDRVMPAVTNAARVAAARMRDLLHSARSVCSARARTPSARSRRTRPPPADGRIGPRRRTCAATPARHGRRASCRRLWPVARMQRVRERVHAEIRAGSSPSLLRKPWTRCPASPTSVRPAIRSVGPGSEAMQSSARRRPAGRGRRSAPKRSRTLLA